MFFKKVKISEIDLENLLAKDNQGLMEYLQNYYVRKFYIGDTGINRKTLKDWESNELLPYKYNEEGWRKFSFVEWVWLECINELRQMGVSLEKIKDIRRMIFDANVEEIFALLKEQMDSYEGEIDNKRELLAVFDNPDLTSEAKKQILEESQLSVLLLSVASIIITDANMCLIYNNNDSCSLFVMGPGFDKQKAHKEVLDNLVNESFVVVNLRKIVNQIIQKPGLRHNDDFVIDFVSSGERIVLDEMRAKNAKEITITFDAESNPTHIEVNRNQISQEVLNKVARYLKKGSYQIVEFRTRDGQLIKYNETDIKKLTI